MLVEIVVYKRGMVTLSTNFKGNGALPTNDCWHQKMSPWAIVSK